MLARINMTPTSVSLETLARVYDHVTLAAPSANVSAIQSAVDQSVSATLGPTLTSVTKTRSNRGLDTQSLLGTLRPWYGRVERTELATVKDIQHFFQIMSCPCTYM